MSTNPLQEWLDTNATELQVPGVAAAIYEDGKETYAFHGVTSIENPLPVDATTLFQYGSTHKTFTATAIMRLVDQGLVDLNEKVKTYVPELRLKDKGAEEVTVLQLLNHTAGWSGDAHENTGDGDDARAKFVESMADLEQVTPLGSTVSYNNASLNLAGYVIEKVTGKVYESAVKELLYEPLCLESTFFYPNDVMSRRFVVGHRQDPDGSIHVARPWALSRAGAPAGGFGVTANAANQIAWARFHLGDGTAPDGTRLMSRELLDSMKEPTVHMPGSAIGDAVGISWLLEEFGGAKLVGHGGTTIGQYSEFLMVPERNFALISMTNCGPNGSQLNRAIQRFALETFLGLEEPEGVEPLLLDEAALADYIGTYETVAVWAHITAEGGGLLLEVEVKPETARQMREEGEDIPDQPPIPFGMLPGAGDKYVVTDGAAKGMKGYFVRGADGKVEGAHVGGRLATRVRTPVPA